MRVFITRTMSNDNNFDFLNRIIPFKMYCFYPTEGYYWRWYSFTNCCRAHFSALTSCFRLPSLEISEFLLILTFRCGPTSHDRCRPVFRSCVSSVQFAVQCPDPWSSRCLQLLFFVVLTIPKCDTCRHLPTPSSAAPVCYECSSSTRPLVV